MVNSKIKYGLLKYNYSIICLAALIAGYLILKVNLAFSYHEVIWDEAVYIGIGKYIYSLGEIGVWESIRPLGLSLILGLIWKSGLPVALFSELAIILFSAINIAMVYVITKQLSNEKAALFASIIFTISPIFFYQSSFILTHIPAIFFTLVAIYLVVKERYFYSGMFIAVGFLFRYPQGVLLAAICAYILINRENRKRPYLKYRHLKEAFRKIFLILAGFLVILFPLLILNYIKYDGNVLLPFIEAGKHQGNIVYQIQSPVYNIFFYLIELLRQNPLLIFAFIGIFFYYREREKSKTYPCSIIIFASFLLPFLYYTAIVNKQLRFSIEFLPYLSILAGYGLHETYDKISYKKIVRVMFIVIVLVLMSVPLNINYEQYVWRTDVETETTAKVHKYFLNNNLTLPVLTTDPTFLAYTDVKAYSFYEDIPTALINYGTYRNKSAYILYNTEFYPCYNEEKCKDRQLLFEVIKSENELIFNKDTFYIFRNNDYNLSNSLLD
ncbi:glycosyltransferase family 39 protein [Candidatus Woesearchaeota archaeon]|nr:glycosyltransferase family 39 protein [Candidatus Woesearchaeota archaeon]